VKIKNNIKTTLLFVLPVVMLGIGIFIGINMHKLEEYNVTPTVNAISSSNPYITEHVLSTSPTRNTTPYTLSAGTYTVGTNIQAGTYDVFRQSGSGVVITKNMQEMFGNSDGYIRQYKNLVLNYGDTVKITSDLTVNFDPK
jgi:hypothetical protein